jgi:hypothetical protein
LDREETSAIERRLEAANAIIADLNGMLSEGYSLMKELLRDADEHDICEPERERARAWLAKMEGRAWKSKKETA